MGDFAIPRISLLDLTKQMPFEIDDVLKNEICFGETLIVSCGHYDGEIGGESSDSEWSCQDTESESSEEIREDKMMVIKDYVPDDPEPEKPTEEEDDFYFYFFPDCTKPPPPQDSKSSLIVVDGMPQINTAHKKQIICTCNVAKKGECDCFSKLPCKCGAKVKADCVCSKLEDICTCQGGNIKVKCTCKGSEVCLCFPDGLKPTCTCENVQKPCICQSDKFPYPVCPCPYKPKFLEELKSIGEVGEHEEDKNVNVHEEHEKEQCLCQKPDPQPVCKCGKRKDCICFDAACVCGAQKRCDCRRTDSHEPICKSDDSKSICKCPDTPPGCTCERDGIDCKCFPQKICNCGNPVNCKCFTVCDCTEPCICDTKYVSPTDCICLDPKKADTDLCTCTGAKVQKDKLKRVKAGKHGYRWCHDVDPRHTYFDYAYGRYDKISYKEIDNEKFKILGLGDDNDEEEICPVHGVEAPAPYKKNIRKPSIDCCSSVGGISINVESLGEDKDKFLVQVVSHSSKEGAKTGSKLVSILDCNLHTMEENRIEHITKKDLTKEHRSYIAICEKGYYNKVTRICRDRQVVKRHYHTFENSRNFLLEGANVVLMRYFGLKRYRGNIKTETIMMDGTICESIYICNGVSQAIVNGKPLFVVKVERHIVEPSGYIHQTLTVLTLRGYMVSHEWADNNYILHINPLLKVVPEKDLIEEHVPMREKWREDLQLLSDYLDFKSARTSEGGRYMSENGALTGTIRDYLQALLLLRPHDALHFTRHYFSSAISALDLPHDEYFDPTSKHVKYYFFEQ